MSVEEPPTPEAAPAEAQPGEEEAAVPAKAAPPAEAEAEAEAEAAPEDYPPEAAATEEAPPSDIPVLEKAAAPAENGAPPAPAPAAAEKTTKEESATVDGPPGASPPAEGTAESAATEEQLKKPDYDKPIPLDHVPTEDGKKAPLPGVESLFCTSSTLALLELSDICADPVEGQPLVRSKRIAKDVVLKDIQFRGSISDFHFMKKIIEESDLDMLLVRFNEDDIYGDGNNIELVVKQSALDQWESIGVEIEKRRKWEEAEAARAAAEKALPKSKRTRVRQPWVSLGSEAEIEEEMVKPTRKPIYMTVQRRRREFNQDYKLADKDSHELWNSAQMECRPFRDPNFDLRRSELEIGTQAVPEQRDMAVQATGALPCPGSTQYVPREMPLEERKQVMASEGMKAFLSLVTPRLDEALQQNEITNVFEDDFTTLAEEDGMSGNKKENVITEYQSFTDLTYSKNKVVQAIQWVPGTKGVVAISCTEPLSFTERVQTAGRTSNSAILIWNFKDPINPDYVLEAPFEVTSFSFNPANHSCITAGLLNGRVVHWDISNERARILAAKSVKREDGKDEQAQLAVIQATHVSAPDNSHKTRVTDLTWLPGLEITRDGKLLDVNSEEAKEKGVNPRECNFFATTAADGAIMFWDIRVERSRKRGQKESDDIAWSPLYVVPLLDQNGRDLASMKFSFNKKDPFTSEMMVGSADGEIVYAEYAKPEGVDHPEYSKFCVEGHSGPVVAVQRSPFYVNFLLTVGDWCFNVWKEGLDRPIFVSPYATNYVTDGCWSPTRPGVIYIAKQDGELDVWDLLDRSHEPAITSTISSAPIMSISFDEKNQTAARQMLAIGDFVGVLHVMELPRNLRRPVANEKQLMMAFLERQHSRVSYTEEELVPARATRMKEIEAAAQAAKDSTDKDKDSKPKAQTKEVSAQELLEIEYDKLEHEFKLELGLITEEEAT